MNDFIKKIKDNSDKIAKGLACATGSILAIAIAVDKLEEDSSFVNAIVLGLVVGSQVFCVRSIIDIVNEEAEEELA